MKKILLSCCLIAPGLLSAQFNIDDFVTNSSSNIYTTIVAGQNGVSNVVDMDWHPTRTDELWVLNTGTANSGGTTVVVFDAGNAGQTSQFVKDGNSWHFLASGSSMAFGENENWGTAQGRLDANHNGSTFTGPTLWSSDLTIYGVLGNPPTQFMNGSHLDMLHQSPYGMGIAHEVDNVYWVFDGYNGNICRYDFVQDHGPGQADHSDGRIKRYTEVQVQRSGDIPSHMVLDKSTGWLYLCDVGNGRVLRMDINTGNIKNALPSANGEPITEHSEMENVVWEQYITSGLTRPTGIDVDVSGTRLAVSDYATGMIHIYDITGSTPVEVGTISPGSGNVDEICGVKFGPDNRLWYADRSLRRVVRIDNPNNISVNVDDLDINTGWVQMYPNPTTGLVNVNLENLVQGVNYRLELNDIVGKSAMQTALLGSQNTLDLNNLSKGIYLARVFADGELIQTQKLVLK